ncbi:hypothetical protein MNEG_7382 [Monoraphidium neglectum]|uniref:Uncharacterized protein n=1 Tax=Monoraphidium neglectum TaxID=145388 RepID=A0A0D2JN37_9CHLO|nr:hypothetical protein MNEG_7382 [Monoraphidium neglectum]KIZ00578.1 hypothetical protein MNEG_7382 [Monoraphidium neglectum]|eukprot:XP_013899597.1 hypothetical protein MNEG_7382 [Monoraphidium neglectum]
MMVHRIPSGGGGPPAEGAAAAAAAAGAAAVTPAAAVAAGGPAGAAAAEAAVAAKAAAEARPKPAAAAAAPSCPSRRRPQHLLPLEVWARGPSAGPLAAAGGAAAAEALQKAVPAATKQQLRDLCARCLYRTLTSYARVHGMGAMTVVLTGDIPAMWTRDSAVQMATYLPRIRKRPALRRVVEGSIRAQAFFLLQDPWANAYNPAYKLPSTGSKLDRQLGRGGWVWTRNFELDSIGYYFNFLWNWYATPEIWGPEQLLNEAVIHDAVVVCLKVMVIEQRHNELSPYRYSELANNGIGPANNYTGMVWSAFRPNDNPPTNPFHHRTPYHSPKNDDLAPRHGLQRVPPQ